MGLEDIGPMEAPSQSDLADHAGGQAGLPWISQGLLDACVQMTESSSSSLHKVQRSKKSGPLWVLFENYVDLLANVIQTLFSKLTAQRDLCLKEIL